MELVSKVAVVAAGFGAIIGALCAFVPNAWLCLFIMLVFLYPIYKIVPLAVKVPPAQFPGGKGKMISTSITPYFLMWLVFWVLVYTLIF
jgi:hypothetical protein